MCHSVDAECSRNVKNQCHSGSVGTKQGVMGQNRVTNRSNKVGCPGHFGRSVGHMGHLGHVGHRANDFMLKGIWGYWILLSGSDGLLACHIGHGVCPPRGISHHVPMRLTEPVL